MDYHGAKASNGPGWAWARTGAVILFVLTGILLLASLTQAKTINGGAAGQHSLFVASSSPAPGSVRN